MTKMAISRSLLLATSCFFSITTAWIPPIIYKSSVKVSKCSFTSLQMANDDAAPTPDAVLLSVSDCLELHPHNHVVFCDATWFHKGNRNGRQEFQDGPRIQGARHLDIGDIATTQDIYPILNPLGLTTMLPNADLFALAMDEFNITNDDHVIIYAKEGALFTPRAYFMFQHFGHAHVSLMQGSLEEWIQQGGPVDTEPTTVPTALSILAAAKSRRPDYQCKTQNNVVDKYQMMEFVEKQQAVIIDPRGSSFQYGSIPGALNIPYSSLVEPDNALKLKSRNELEEIFSTHGIDIFDVNQEVIASCGSGVSACHVVLALQECGRTDNVYMYDGSWQEWKCDPNTPKVLTPHE